jgi:hypothetical protein
MPIAEQVSVIVNMRHSRTVRDDVEEAMLDEYIFLREEVFFVCLFVCCCCNDLMFLLCSLSALRKNPQIRQQLHKCNSCAPRWKNSFVVHCYCLHSS